MSKFG